MAERRMFAKTIIDSDAFLDMPLSAQALYFHLSMRADDEGFINNPKKIQRMVSSSDDDIKLLIAKSFIIPFESGVVVIKHWKIHNYIQKDRFKPTVYQDEREQLGVKNNNAYTLDTSCIQEVSSSETQVRLGKNRLGKNNIYAQMFDAFWKIYPKHKDKAKALKAFTKLKPNEELFNKIIDAVNNNIKNNTDWKKDNGQYVPYGASWLNGKRWEDEISNNTSAKKYKPFI